MYVNSNWKFALLKQITCHHFHLNTVNKIIPEVHLHGLREEIPLETWEERAQQQTKSSWKNRGSRKTGQLLFKDQKTKLRTFRTIFVYLQSLPPALLEVISCSCEIAIDLEAWNFLGTICWQVVICCCNLQSSWPVSNLLKYWFALGSVRNSFVSYLVPIC